MNHYDVVASCEFVAIVGDEDGEEVLGMAEAGAVAWIEESGVRSGDVAALAVGIRTFLHPIEADAPSEIANEIMTAAEMNEIRAGDRLVVVRRDRR